MTYAGTLLFDCIRCIDLIGLSCSTGLSSLAQLFLNLKKLRTLFLALCFTLGFLFLGATTFFFATRILSFLFSCSFCRFGLTSLLAKQTTAP